MATLEMHITVKRFNFLGFIMGKKPNGNMFPELI